jgi:hypothetical protein
MIKQLGLVGGAVALACLATGSAVPAAGSSDDDDDRVKVLAVHVEEEFIDPDGDGPTLGDMLVFSAEVYKKGDDVGEAGVVCTVVSVEREQFRCVGSVLIGRSQITAEGLTGSTDPQRFAITGGTGKYRDAAGELKTEFISETEELWTFILTD